jgi:hypothetical protein
MKFRTAQFFLLLALVTLAALFSGCSSTEPDNASVRPWNAPQGWEGNSLDGMQTQHQ